MNWFFCSDFDENLFPSKEKDQKEKKSSKASDDFMYKEILILKNTYFLLYIIYIYIHFLIVIYTYIPESYFLL